MDIVETLDIEHKRIITYTSFTIRYYQQLEPLTDCSLNSLELKDLHCTLTSPISAQMTFKESSDTNIRFSDTLIQFPIMPCFDLHNDI